MRKAIAGQRQLAYWRLELGSLTSALDSFLKNHANKATSEEIGEIEWWNTILAADREQLFTDETIEDHGSRLLDLAYVMHLRSDAGAR